METNEAASRPGKPALLSCSQCPVLQFWAAAKPGTARHPLPPVPAEPALAPPAQGMGCERSLGIAALVRELGKRLSLGKGGPGGLLSLSTAPWQEGTARWGQALLWTDGRVRGHRFEVQQGRCRLGTKRNFFGERVIRHWNGLPREVGEALSLEVFEQRLHKALSTMVCRCGGGSQAGFSDLQGPFQPQ